MRRSVCVSVALLVCSPSMLACDDATPRAESGEKGGSAASPKPAPSTIALTLPDVDVGHGDDMPLKGATALWIGRDAIWAGRHRQGEPVRVMATADAREELLEPLAAKLDALRDEGRSEPRFTDQMPLALHADARTSVDVLRRVLTTARATSHLDIHYLVGNENPKALALRAPVPFDEGEKYPEFVIVDIAADGSVTVNRRTLGEGRSHEQLLSAARGRRCVGVRSSGLDYQSWLSALAKIPEKELACIGIAAVDGVEPNPQISPPPPPPPPPPAPEDEDEDFAAAPPTPAAAPKAKHNPVTERISFWWAKAEKTRYSRTP